MEMVIKPKTRGFVCITAHPDGCAQHVATQIAAVEEAGAIDAGPKRVLVLGASTGYGLASRIVSAIGCGAGTLGVCYERPAGDEKPASAGWYNTAAFEAECAKRGIYARTLNGDAFDDAMKAQVVERIRADLGTVDLVVYSLAAPRRTDPETGVVYKSCLKPIGETFTAKNLNTDKARIEPVEIQPAQADEIEGTVKVMGGEDWERWMTLLEREGLLAEGCTSVAYDYIGPEITWPVYHNGTIGRAKQHLRETAQRIDAMLKVQRGAAFISVNKAVVTQASSAIPVVPLYISILFKVMKAAGLHEDCIHQIDRLFRSQMYNHRALVFDDAGRVRMDDWEMRPDIQAQVAEVWQRVETANLHEETDFAGYQENFLRLFGFGLDGVDYEKPTAIERPWA